MTANVDNPNKLQPVPAMDVVAHAVLGARRHLCTGSCCLGPGGCKCREGCTHQSHPR